MRIKTIEITNYKAFHGAHKINVGGKNLFIYGENGSGKSSLYYALKDFFQSSMETIDLAQVENIFVAEAEKGNCAIAVTFETDDSGRSRTQRFTFSATSINQDVSLRDANKLKSFLTYKHLLDIHHIKREQEINLFNLLVKGVLKHFRYSLTGGKELGELWQAVESAIARQTDRSYQITQKRRDVATALKAFNDAFSELFIESSPEYILKHAKPILDHFGHAVDLKLYYGQARPNQDHDGLENNYVHVELTYAGKKVAKPHLFLNEARLSAIAISIYLGMIKRHIQGIPCKILFLDDIFIGLDIANRLPLLEVLRTEFTDYQIFITTYDKPWFEHARSFLEGAAGWATLEFYTEISQAGFEIPKIFDNQDLLTKATYHYTHSDYKAAAVYTRSAFEKIIRNYCEQKRKKIAFKSKLKDYESQDFWNEVYPDILPATKADIESYRSLVLNAFSHYNTEKHEIKRELANAIKAVKDLKKELDAIR